MGILPDRRANDVEKYYTEWIPIREQKKNTR